MKKQGNCERCKQPLYGDDWGPAGHRCEANMTTKPTDPESVSNTELKQCPFCASADIDPNGVCFNCLGMGPNDEIENREGFSWNTRPIEDALTSERDRYRKALEEIDGINRGLYLTPLSIRIMLEVISHMGKLAAAALAGGEDGN
jgi:hypothetical protein